MSVNRGHWFDDERRFRSLMGNSDNLFTDIVQAGKYNYYQQSLEARAVDREGMICDQIVTKRCENMGKYQDC